jgi:hypothetical protein
MLTAEKIYIGGWFQRTTLHLSEIYDFLKNADSPLDLDKKKLRDLRAAMNIRSVDMKLAHLDYIHLITTAGVEVKIYEDGLIVLSKNESAEIAKDINALTAYYERKLSPGFGYIFSLGAPVPKELANIQTIYPYFIVLRGAQKGEIEALLKQFKQEKYFEIEKKEFAIYRGNKLYIINNFSEDAAHIEDFVEEQVFMREFKGQLHRYLNLHRIIWERIAEVKEKGEMRGRDIAPFKEKIESYNKTINLIEARISQMGAYIRTRESIVKNNAGLANFLDVLNFKYETLADTLAYIKDIWNMTKNYVRSALDLFGSIQAKSTESSVRTLTVITSMGVGATLMGLFSQKPPTFTMFGVLYFFVLAAIGYGTDKIMKTVYMRRMYKVKDAELAKDIR